MELIEFTSNTDTFIIYYPFDFIVDEDEDGVVSFTSPTTYSNLTVSSYSINKEVDDDFLVSFFKDSTTNFTLQSEINQMQSKHGLLIEGWFEQEGVNWVWWSIKDNLTILLISLNYNKMTDEEYGLFRFMIDNISFLN